MELNQWQLHYPFAEQASLCFEREKKAYIAGLGRDQLEHLASPMTKSESKYQRVQDKSETIEKRLESGLEYYSPTIKIKFWEFAMKISNILYNMMHINTSCHSILRNSIFYIIFTCMVL